MLNQKDNILFKTFKKRSYGKEYICLPRVFLMVFACSIKLERKEHFFGSIAFLIGFPRMLPAKTWLLGFSNTTQLLYLLPQLPQLLELCYLLGGSLLECIYFMMGMQSIIFGKYDIQLRQCVQGLRLVYCFINKGAKVQESLYLCIPTQLYLKTGKMCRSSTSLCLPDLSFCLLSLLKCISYFEQFLLRRRVKEFLSSFTYIQGWFDSRSFSLSPD